MEAELGQLGGGFLGDEWDALCKMFSSDDADLLRVQLHADDHGMPSNESNPGFCFPNQSLFFPINDAHVENVGNTVDGNNSQCFDVLEYLNFHNSSSENEGQYSFNLNLEFYHTPKLLEELPKHVISPREEMGNYDEFGNTTDEQQYSSIGDSSNEHNLLKRKLGSPQAPIEAIFPENPAKKPRVSRNTCKSKTNVQSKAKKNTIKGKNVVMNSHEEEVVNNGVQNGEISSYCSSEDDSQKSNGGATSNGKTRASRGSATDPQSLYARRRRERINERLRILQNLIPNGTKVDISTMLEDAVHYVKFLQLQIKLLSSDDLWMYAPIIHNGVDVGMYNQIFTTL